MSVTLFAMKSKTKVRIIEIDGEKYTIRKLPLGRYADLIGAIEKLPKLFDQYLELSKESIVKMIPKVMKDSLPEFLDLLIAYSEIPEEVIKEKAGLDDGIEIAEAIFEVNNLQMVVKNIGRLFGKLENRKEKEAEEKPEPESTETGSKI